MIFFPKINLFTPNPKGCKLIFNTPFRAGADVENQQPVKYFNKIKKLFFNETEIHGISSA